jgi:hypothetical protein
LDFLTYPVIAPGISTGSDARWHMIRGIFRLLGLLLLAGGFVFMVYDGARWVADQTLRFTRFGQFWNDIHQSSQQVFRSWVEGHAPWLWSGIVRVVLDQPVFLVMGLLGILLMLLFRPRKPLIGYSRN